MKTRIYYRIDGVNENFPSLRAAKLHVSIAYTPEERLRELKGTSIVGYKNDEPYSNTFIIVNELGSYAFGITKKF